MNATTADEPDSTLLALANDESREVLVFKMAVALGFDAPRAGILVSMRAARDEDFGVQLVGRILRVHRRLQGRARAKTLPPLLRYGFVFLADAESQVGLDLAGQRINKMHTEFAKVSPTTAIMWVGNKAFVQGLGPDGQTQLFPVASPTPAHLEIRESGEGGTATVAGYGGFTLDLLTGIYTPLNLPAGSAETSSKPRATGVIPALRDHKYPLRADVPRRFKTQVVSPDSDVTEEDCAHRFIVSSEEILRALVAKVQIERRTLEVFTRQLEMELTNAAMEPDRAARIALKVLMKNGNFDPRELRRALVRKLKVTLRELAMNQPADDEQVNHMLNVILCGHPELLVAAQKAALAAHAEVEEAEEELPQVIASEEPLRTSRLNVYSVMPPGLNGWETSFAQFLDGDGQNIVKWWHRNPSRQPWSVQVVLDNGRGFFPDFVIGIEGRKRENGALLADPKFFFEITQELPKSYAEHPSYGRVLIVNLQGGTQWMTVRYDKPRQKAVLGGEFHLADAVGY